VVGVDPDRETLLLQVKADTHDGLRVIAPGERGLEPTPASAVHQDQCSQAARGSDDRADLARPPAQVAGDVAETSADQAYQRDGRPPSYVEASTAKQRRAGIPSAPR
jgi:hypothetical protein